MDLVEQPITDGVGHRLVDVEANNRAKWSLGKCFPHHLQHVGLVVVILIRLHVRIAEEMEWI